MQVTTALKTENKENIQNLLNVVKKESSKKELDLHSKTPEVITISKKKTSECNILVMELNKNKNLLNIFEHSHHTRRQRPLWSKLKNWAGKSSISKDEKSIKKKKKKKKTMSVATRQRAHVWMWGVDNN